MILRSTAALALLVAVAAVRAESPATAPAADAMVDNPAYVAWSRAAPGTVVEQSLNGSRGGRSYAVVIKTTLVAVTADSAKIDQVLTMAGAPPKTQTIDVPAKVASSVLNVTSTPGMSRKDVGREDVVVDGKTYACVIREIAGTAPNGTAVNLRSWESLDFPGNIVRSHSKADASETKLESTKVARPK
jgi:hypothetical protein